jgi:hypothetical protein
MPGRMKRLLVIVLAGLVAAPAARAAVRPVPSLTPAATHALWLKEVARAATHPRRLADAGCRPARVVFYAQTDWLRLVTKLAAAPSPCAQYYVSVPPLVADKTQARSGQASQMRALGPQFHAVDEINYTAWSNWVAAGNGSWADAGAVARQRMAASGFDASAGDTWALNELSSAVRAGTGSARANAGAFLNALAGDGVKGIVFTAGVGQSTPDLSIYKANLQNWLQDSTFWNAIGNDTSDFAYETYGDARDYAVAGSSPQQRRDALVQYLGHVETLANVGPDAAAAARSVLQQTYSTFGNAAWSWPSAYGYTAVPLPTMEDFVAGQAYAARSFAAAAGASVDRLGYAWAPAGVSTTDSGALLDVLATSIRDSGTPTDDPGILACASNRCGTAVDGAQFTTLWAQFSAWSPSAVAFASAPLSLTAGAVAGPLTLQVQTAGAADTAKSNLPVTLATSSPGGGFAASAGGPFSPTLTLTIPAGSSSIQAFYTDTSAGTPTITASIAGQPGVAQTATVAPAAVARLAIAPASAKVEPGTRQQFTITAADAYGNVEPAQVTWSATIGDVSATGLFTAPKTGGAGTVTATVGTFSATARIVVPKLRPKIASVKTTRVAGHVVVTVVTAPRARVRILLRVRRGSSTVAVVRTATSRAGTYTWRSAHKLPSGRYVARATLR